jgi:hypothetical protein
MRNRLERKRARQGFVKISHSVTAPMSLFLGRETEEIEEKPDASRAGHPPVMDGPIPLCARDGLDRLAPLTPLPSAGRGRPCPAFSAWVVLSHGTLSLR